MERLRAYEYIILAHPAKKDDPPTYILKGPNTVAARDELHARLLAAMKLDTNVGIADRLEVVVRPF